LYVPPVLVLYLYHTEYQDSERSRGEGESAYNVLMRTNGAGGAIRSSRKLPLVLQVCLLLAFCQTGRADSNSIVDTRG
jgi:hypothetical protein